MSILLDTPTTADYDLTISTSIVLSHTMVAAGDVRVVIRVGTNAKPCVALAGVWELYFYVSVDGGGYNIEPYPQEVLTTASALKLFVSRVCDVSAGAIVGVMLKSPNAGDTDVAVSAEIWHVSGSLPAVVPNAAGGLPVLDANSRVAANVTAMAANVIAAAAIANDAISAAAIAAAAVTKIQAGLATSANQTTILSRIGAFTGSGVNTILGFLKALMSKGAATPSDVGGTFNAATDSTEALEEAIGPVSPGSGSKTVVLHYEHADTTPVADADVWVTLTADAEGTAIASGQTDSSGNVTLLLDPGTYYKHMQKDGEQPRIGTPFTVTA